MAVYMVSPMPAGGQRHPVPVVELGILREDEPLELLEGVLVEMGPRGPVHAGSSALLADALREAYRGRGSVREEKPIAVDEYNLPEPDIAVVRGRAESYSQRHPGGANIVVLVELAAAPRRLTANGSGGRGGQVAMIDATGQGLGTRVLGSGALDG